MQTRVRSGRKTARPALASHVNAPQSNQSSTAELFAKVDKELGIVHDDGDARVDNALCFRSSSRLPLEKRKARPASAPAVRVERTDPNKSSGNPSMSIEYLRLAAAKRKEKERVFARELQRQDQDYKAKITLHIEQANKIAETTGTKQLFEITSDRDGVLMVKVTENESRRMISGEMFLREFERLATVPLGHHAIDNGLKASTDKQTISTARKSAHLQVAQPSSTKTGSNVAMETRTFQPPSRAQVQQELQGVLRSTVELTKVLQSQLNELKLKGWNFTASDRMYPS